MPPQVLTTISGILILLLLLIISPAPAQADLLLGPVEYVQAGGVDIDVPGYSVPTFDYWNGDSLKDLIVGEGGGTVAPGMVRVYLNVGTTAEPSFSDSFYVQSEGADLVLPGAG